jgi:hypothetical protein
VSVILTFATIHDALAAEKAARLTRGTAQGGEEELVPLPPQVKSDCGFGLFIPAATKLEDTRIVSLVESGVEFSEAYRVYESDVHDGQRKEKRYERID